MGILDFIKRRESQRVNTESLSTYLLTARNNIKLASEHIGKFLQDTNDFEPASRHRALYQDEVVKKLKIVRGGILGGLIFIDERMRNELNTQNPIRNVNQLKLLVEEWIKTLDSSDEEVYDVLKILQVEMWSEDKARRGFPLPRNNELVCNYLTKTVDYLKEARDNLDNYSTLTNVPETD